MQRLPPRLMKQFACRNGALDRLDEAGLFSGSSTSKNVDLHPDKIDNPTMGTIFEELIRKFNEALNEKSP